MTSDVRIELHRYKYFPYERVLAEREAVSLLGPRRIRWDGDSLVAEDATRPEAAAGLTYAASFDSGGGSAPTRQFLIENAALRKRGRQVTRYASHGLHEYKGKFNPQIVRFLLNFLGAEPGQLVLDPFAGSGTSLVEASLLGLSSVGIDANPASSMLAITKVRLLCSDVTAIRRSVVTALMDASGDPEQELDASDPRIGYLLKWFPATTLNLLERVRVRLRRRSALPQQFGLLVVSNYLREFSLQDPMDLRIRRRSHAPSHDALIPMAIEHLDKVLAEVASTIKTVGSESLRSTQCSVVQGDAASASVVHSALNGSSPNLIVTSPPYAMALPYIDTQRLSLVWLGLLDPSEIRIAGERQIGNREVGGKQIANLNERILCNESNLAQSASSLCREMLSALNSKDGFRRRAVPALCYQYFEQMSRMFSSVRANARAGTPFALVVGRNRTKLGGNDFAVDTPRLLADVAEIHGWELEDSIPLEAYQRFGLHAANAIASEQLVVLRAK